jgi:hypothetical protein
MSDERAAREHDVLPDRGVRADDDAGTGEAADPDPGGAGDVRPRVDERRELPAGGQEPSDDGSPR